MLKLLKNASLLLLVNATAHAGADCGAMLAGVEGTARSAQNSMLVAQARDEQVNLGAAISELQKQVNALQASCGGSVEPAAMQHSDENKKGGLADFLPDFGAVPDQDAPKRPNAAQRSHGRF